VNVPEGSAVLAGACPQQPAKGVQPLLPAGSRVALGDPGIEGAVRFVVAAAARTPVLGALPELGEVPDDRVGLDVREPEGADPRGVDDPARRIRVPLPQEPGLLRSVYLPLSQEPGLLRSVGLPFSQEPGLLRALRVPFLQEPRLLRRGG